MNQPPVYDDLPGSCTFPPPSVMTGCHARVYVLGAKRKTLQAAVDQWLNLPFNDIFDYVAMPWVCLVTMPIQSITSPDAPGVTSETDVGFMVSLAAVRKTTYPQPQAVVDHFAIAFPFILVDNPLTLIGGREIWGWRKELGTYDLFPGTNMPIAASTLVMPNPDPGTTWISAEIMRMDGLIDDLALAPGNTVCGDLEHLAAVVLEEGESILERVEDKLLDDAARWILKHCLDARVLLHEMLKFVQNHKKMQCAFLLEQRDCAAPCYASYQALVEAPMVVTELESILPYLRTPVTLSNYPSYPIVSNLGIICDSDYKAKPLAAFDLRFSFELLDGRVIAEPVW